MGTKKTIAILEDDHQLRETMRTFFTQKGFQVDDAPCGFDIIKDLVARKPDVVITDLGLPGVSGDLVLTATRVRELVAGTPVIVISGMPEKDVQAASQRIGAVAVLAKPFDMDKLLALVNQHIAA